eukprot:TRINITY_DN11656_c0_g1_i1.p1 TRINITY_DN11656_c0_g1~~TRINITY_DN11656_c0_g1_i1.p1  ORF type:complete len:107 (+),score=19.06 TRINITY_DN11656_c0_g1_i1:160-480(+)
MWEWHVESKDKDDPLASLYKASPQLLASLPPTLLYTAEFDPLRDEGEQFGRLLIQQGVDVQIRRFQSTIHGFFHHGKETNCPWHDDYSSLAIDILNSWLKQIVRKL